MASTSSVFLVALFIPATMADSAQCSAEFDPEMRNTDMSGTLIGMKWANTSDDCCSLCTQENGCEGFAYAGDTCFLKNAFEGTYEQLDVVTRLRKDRPQCSSDYDVEVEGMDMAGGLIATKLALTSDYCCSMCDAESACEGFVFAHHHCYLKKDFAGMYRNDDAVARLKHSVASCPSSLSVSMLDTDLSGILLAEKYASTSAGCCPLCEQMPECEGFAFASKTCFLKSQITGTYTTAGTVTRIKSKPEKPTVCSADYSEEKSACDVAGELLGKQWGLTMTSDDCCDLCDNTVRCEGFAFVDNTCYLKAKVEGTYEQNGVVCRIKKGRRLGDVMV